MPNKRYPPGTKVYCVVASFPTPDNKYAVLNTDVPGVVTGRLHPSRYHVEVVFLDGTTRVLDISHVSLIKRSKP